MGRHAGSTRCGMAGASACQGIYHTVARGRTRCIGGIIRVRRCMLSRVDGMGMDVQDVELELLVRSAAGATNRRNHFCSRGTGRG
jgi:hypothetical protein